MGMNEADVLRHPLLGPLIGRAPENPVPPPKQGGDGRKRVRWNVARVLVARGEVMTAAQIRHATGFGAKEIGVALAKLIAAKEVEAIDNFLGQRKGYRWTKARQLRP